MYILKKLTVSFFILFVCMACSGYRVKNRENPLSLYGIKTIAVPMFINQTSLSNISGPMTKEIKSLLMDFTELKVKSSFEPHFEAVLVGIITSEPHRKNVVKAISTKYTSGSLETSIGSRNKFFIPNQAQIEVQLRLILVKRPSSSEYELMRTSLGQYLKAQPQNNIIFNELLSLSGRYTRIIDDTLSVDHGGIVNFTKNKKAEEVTIRQLSLRAAKDFKEVILNAF